jgi:hypothetical protein
MATLKQRIIVGMTSRKPLKREAILPGVKLPLRPAPTKRQKRPKPRCRSSVNSAAHGTLLC